MNTTALALLVVVIVLAAGLGLSLYIGLGEKRSLEESLGECKSALGEASSRVDELEEELSTCRSTLEKERALRESAEAELERVKSSYNELLRNYTRLGVEYNRTLDEYKRLLGDFEELKSTLALLQENYTSLMAAYRGIKEDYSALEGKYERLKHNYTVLLESHARLKSMYESLYQNYTLLSNSYRELQSRYESLKRDYESVSRLYEGLKKDYSELKSEYEKLRGDYERLAADYHRLSENYTLLSRAYEDLAAEHEKLTSMLENTSMWLGLIWDSSAALEFYSAVLGISVDQVKLIIDYAGFSGELGERAFDVFESLLYWLYYCPDSYVRYVDKDSLEVGVRGEVFMLPNETWEKECGDCEDLALFTYALLKATERPDEKLYLVEFYDVWGEGHAGVLAVRVSGNVKEYYVIDLAGNYLNGIKVYYRATIVAPNGSTWYYYFDPILLTYNDKKTLASIVEVVYYDYWQDKVLTERSIYYYTDAFSALQDWIVDYWGTFPVGNIVVINEHNYKVFTSITDAAKWIEENAVQGT